MARGAFVRRHRARIASAAALAVATGAVVAYAVTADGYPAHEAELNDGGVWVVNGAKGWSGRINKPINQHDGVVPGDDSKLRMDILQDGAAVVAVNLDSARAQAIEPARLANVEGGAAAVPTDGDVAMAGGSLASTDSETGEVWAARYDARRGRPTMSAVDRNGEPQASVGKASSLTVSQAGTVVAVSAEESTVTTLRPAGDGFASPEEVPLGADAGEPTSVTAVGERVVTLDAPDGTLQVVGGPTVEVPEDSVLQQAGPAAGQVLVGTRTGLLAVDLESGTTTEIVASSGTPAAPVRLGACLFGAWSGGSGSVAQQCGSDGASVEKLKGKATNLVFRVNRGAIVLNDSVSGSVWDVQQDKPIKIDTWESFTSRKKNKEDDKKNEERLEAERRPPKARPDTYGIRQGRTTVVHPLDNDSAPEGRLLSIVDVDAPTNGARVEISPDGQTLVVSLPDAARTSTFEYHVNDGRSGLSAHASVTVNVRAAGVNAQPSQRKGYTKPTFHVSNGGSLSVPVLADWRDDTDGDALLLDSAEVAGGAQSGVTARTTSDGRIRVVAAPLVDAPARTVRVDYAVSDGRSPGVRKALDFRIQAAKDETTHPPTAAPDVVRGEVGRPIKIRPLLNDLPGSDPTTRHAELELGGKIPPQPGAAVRTDVETGVVTLDADKAGTFFLNYDAAFGSAPMDQGTIRVDVRPRPRRDGDPVAMPDNLTIFGQAPGVVDVLANDMDPAGSLLVVRRADPVNAGQLDVAVIDGRWLRVSARRPDLTPSTQVVTYTVSNGPRESRGELVVSQRPQPADNTPITTADHAVVRAGSSVSVPVLDNDVSPGGDRLTLVTDVAEGASGELRVVTPVDLRGDGGRAFVSGRVVRYVAPAGLRERETFEVPYVAQNLAGITAEGRARITVVPADERNTPPEPPTLEGRVVAGDTVKVRLPGAGVDPEGDPVTVTGITSAPRLGRITAHGGNFLEYRAYPRSSGTDEFTYAVMDGKGGFATGTARVAVVALGEPQPPLAVADRLMVKPGRTATFDPLANDFVAPGDSVQVELVEEREGVSLDPTTNLVKIKAPDDVAARAVQVVYRLTNGLAESRATLTLDVNPEFNNPPVVYDAFGRAGESGAVEVDVLEGAHDPDGTTKELKVVEVLGDPAGTVIEGSTITINREEHPQVVPFRVEDADGGSATASVYVPSTGVGLPVVKPDAMVKLDVGGSATGKINDYVDVPDGRTARIVEGDNALDASPSALSVDRDGRNGFTVRSAGEHRGPGAVLVEVTTATSSSGNEDTSTTDDGATALLSIPVQVGEDVPQLTCPTNVIPISTGQRRLLDLATICSVWTVDPRDAAGLPFSADWSTSVDGVSVTRVGGSQVALSVSDDATRGGEAVLAVRAGDSNTAQLRFRLSAAASPTMLPIPVEEMRAGESRTINLAPYLQPGVARPDPRVVQITPIGATQVRASFSGSSITLRAPEGARGRAAFRVRMSDVSDRSPSDERIAEGRIQFEVGGLPGKPGEPQIYRPEESSRVEMDWLRPTDDGGAPITHYVLEAIGTNINRVCRTNRCSLGGLKRDKDYRFRVRAVNKVGAGEWSDPSVVAVALTRPGRVENIKMIAHGDRSITIGWDKPRVNAQRLLEYEIRWADQVVTVPASSRTYPAVVPSNNQTYSFRIRVRNQAGEVSDARESARFQSAGTPAAPGGLQAVDNRSGDNQTSIGLSWASTLPEGRGPTTYTVMFAKGGGGFAAVPGCARLNALRCTHTGVDYDGSTINYVVHAFNALGNRSPASATASIQAVGRPAEWGAWAAAATGRDQQVQIAATVPDPRGSTAEMQVVVGGVAQGSPVRVREGQSINQLVNVPSNLQPYDVLLRLCNEGGCNDSAPKSVQTYGPISDVHLNPISVSASGKTITWQISGNTNGNPAQVSVTIGNGPPQVYPQNMVGNFSFSIQATAENFNQDIDLTATLEDPDPARGRTSESATGRSGPPPDPVIQIAKGEACNDDAEGATGCESTVDINQRCTDDSCAFIAISWVSYEELSCQLQYRTGPVWLRISSTDVPIGTGSNPRVSYFGSPGYEVRASCRNGSITSNTITW